MNRSVLLIPAPEVSSDSLFECLAGEFDVMIAQSGDDALAKARSTSLAVCVMVAGGPRDIGAEELFAEFQRAWPHVVQVWLGGDGRASGLGVYRTLDASVRDEEVLQSVCMASERFDVLDQDRLMIDQLRFARESLIAMTETLEDRLSKQMERLERLYSLGLELNSAHSLEEIAQLVANAITDSLGRAIEVELSDGDEARGTVRANGGGDLGGSIETFALVTSGGEVGRLHLSRASANGAGLSTTEQRIVESIASGAAIAAGNMIRRMERDEAQHATIVALARLAEHRDTETGKHLDRVSRFCTLIALGLREDGVYTDEITDAFVQNLHRSAPLHDIGKVGIADSILLKPGKLTAEEWVTMKTHTTIGAETLREVIEDGSRCEYLRVGYEIAYCHHEKWDGSGYPRGLMGTDIPLSARILALADCYDALTTRRPYKDPWTHAEAMEHILSQAGAHFDPAVVRAFERRQDEADEVRRDLADVVEPSKIETGDY